MSGGATLLSQFIERKMNLEDFMSENSRFYVNGKVRNGSL